MNSPKILRIMNTIVLVVSLALPVASVMYLSVGATFSLGLLLMFMILQRNDRPAKVNYVYALCLFTAIGISSLLHIHATETASALIRDIISVCIFGAKAAFGLWLIQFVDRIMAKRSAKGELSCGK